MTTPPNQPTDDDDRRQRYTERVRKLLERAADTRNLEEERYSCYAKAADLMTRHGIDEAMVRQSQGRGPEPIETYRFEQPNTARHGKARIYAAGAVAEALGCQCAYFYLGQRTPYVVIVGAASDIATARALLPLVMTQAEHAAAAATRAHLAELRRDVIPDLYDDPDAFLARKRRMFFRSFVHGFGRAVAARITARRRALADETPGTGAALVLADRSQRVGEEFTNLFPKLGKPRRDLYSRDGLAAGRDAGKRANLGDNGIDAGSRQALPGR